MVFHGSSREARLPLSADGSRWVLHYNLITQAGLNLQYTLDAWLWKFESIVHEGHGRSFGAMVGGFEYTIFQIADTDLGLFMKYHRDGRDPASTLSTGFDYDLFLGARYALDDVDDTQALAGTLIDLEDGLMPFLIEAERGIGIVGRWKLKPGFWQISMARTYLPPLSATASSISGYPDSFDLSPKQELAPDLHARDTVIFHDIRSRISLGPTFG